MKSIRGRLLAALLPGVAVVLLGGGVAVFLLVRVDLIEGLDAQLRDRQLALMTGASFENEMIEIDEDEVADVGGDAFVEFRDVDGALLFRSDNLEHTRLEIDSPDDLITTINLPLGSTGRAMRTTFQVDPDDEDGTIDTTGLPPSEPIQLMVALDLAPVQQVLTTLIVTLVLVGAAVLVSVLALLVLGVRWGIAPLDRLRRQIAAADDDHADSRFDGNRAPIELQPVYRELNALLNRMEHTLQRERAFADAAAHELRTPIAELRSIAEVAIKWSDPERSANALKELLDIGREMQTLIEMLLQLSRGSADAAMNDVEDVALLPVVERSVERSRSRLKGRQLQIEVDINESAILHTSRCGLETVLRNLIENAVQYTPDGGHVTVTSQPNGQESATIIVRNGPVDLQPSDVQRLFDPFWRKDESRSDRTHVGLGLSVARRLADAAGLRLQAELVADELQMRVSSIGDQ